MRCKALKVKVEFELQAVSLELFYYIINVCVMSELFLDNMPWRMVMSMRKGNCTNFYVEHLYENIFVRSDLSDVVS